MTPLWRVHREIWSCCRALNCRVWPSPNCFQLTCFIVSHKGLVSRCHSRSALWLTQRFGFLFLAFWTVKRKQSPSFFKCDSNQRQAVVWKCTETFSRNVWIQRWSRWRSSKKKTHRSKLTAPDVAVHHKTQHKPIISYIPGAFTSFTTSLLHHLTLTCVSSHFQLCFLSVTCYHSNTPVWIRPCRYRRARLDLGGSWNKAKVQVYDVCVCVCERGPRSATSCCVLRSINLWKHLLVHHTRIISADLHIC